MAKATLPTNFKDDILASSMGSKRRYNVINNSDGTISLEDVTTYTQVGSTFGAAQINATNKAANAAADASKIIDDYDTLMANTQAGYMAGALAVKEMNSNLANLFIKKWVRNTTQITVGANTSVTAQFTIPNINGYTPHAIAGFVCKQGLSIYQCNVSDTTLFIYVRNDTGSNIVNSIDELGAEVVYLKNI